MLAEILSKTIVMSGMFDGWQSPRGALLWQTEGQGVLGRIWYYVKFINRQWTIGNITVSVTGLMIGLGIFLLALLISRTLQSILHRRMEKRGYIDPGIRYTIFRLAHYLIISLGLLFALKSAFGLDLTSLAVLFTALSVGIGFGLQFIAGDLASGFILLFERPVRIGDFITVAGPDSKLTEGRVQSINLRTTVVVTNDHITAILPNSKLVNQELINWSYGGSRSRISVPIGVAYESDVEMVTETLLQAADGVKHVLSEPKPSVQFLGFGESSLDFRLLVWTDRPRRHPQIKSDINYRIARLFRERQIEIPYPQRELRVRGGAALQIDSGPESLEEEDAGQDSRREPEPSIR
ncbi:MAG TPA: mechanosensitive ion channel domain-containing protein [Pyrinomonadaceae bacterium]